MKDKKLNLVNESDRGCVLVGAAILEQYLENMFKLLFDKNKIPKKVQRSIFDSNGALSNFSSKIKLAYSFGYLDKSLYDDLEVVRKIRNDFAHSTNHVDFTDSPKTITIESMHCVQQFKGKMKRYSPSKKPISKGVPEEVIFRAAGYVKYAKSLFCLGVHQLEVELIKATHSVVGGKNA